MQGVKQTSAPQFTVETHQRLSNKIIGVLVVFFLVATTAIGITLLISWQLEGAAAAINDAGSQRMRSYRIGWLLQKVVRGERLEQQVHQEIAQFEQVQYGLEHGDPVRPLLLPLEEDIREAVVLMRKQWSGRLRPLAESVPAAASPVQRAAAMREYDDEVVAFVSGVNRLVSMMERSYVRNTNILRSFQVGLVALALVGTLILIYYFFALVIRPVRRLQEGISRMADEDFSVRVPVVSYDEFGALSLGFNRMADHLRSLYATLEDRVRSKTQSLEARNLELATLYDVAAFLNEPAPVEALGRGFLHRAMSATEAQGGSVRLFDQRSQQVFLSVQEGLSERFVGAENVLGAGECLCGKAIAGDCSLVFDIARPPEGMTLKNCHREGFQTATAFPIRFKKRTLGIFNLYFTGQRTLSPQESHMLEILGQHLGEAIESQRLVQRERELAVSEERNLLAQELHDSIAQSLAFLNIKVQLLSDALKQQDVAGAQEEAALIRTGVQESYDDVRELLTHFRTRVRESDMTSAIAESLRKFEGQTGLSADFECIGRGAPVRQEHETQVLHIIQESLSNVRKHARATAVKVQMEHREDAIVVSVRDDGRGFDIDAANAEGSGQHVGLKIMRERAHRVGARLEVESRPGAGTEVRLILPRAEREVTSE